MTGVSRHQAVVVLGSGWGPAADAFGEPVAALRDDRGARVRRADCGGTSRHDRVVRRGRRADLVLVGRTHLYEGLGLRPVVHGIRTAAAAGCTTRLLTNANGSLRDDWEIGQAVLVRDHLNLTGDVAAGRARASSTSPTAGPPGCAPCARELDPSLVEATYAWLPGPHYETLRGGASGYAGSAATCSGCRRSPRRSRRENVGSRCSGCRRSRPSRVTMRESTRARWWLSRNAGRTDWARCWRTC